MGDMSTPQTDTDRAHVLAGLSGADPRTAARYLTDPASVRPRLRARLALASQIARRHGLIVDGAPADDEGDLVGDEA